MAAIHRFLFLQTGLLSTPIALASLMIIHMYRCVWYVAYHKVFPNDVTYSRQSVDLYTTLYDKKIHTLGMDAWIPIHPCSCRWSIWTSSIFFTLHKVQSVKGFCWSSAWIVTGRRQVTTDQAKPFLAGHPIPGCYSTGKNCLPPSNTCHIHVYRVLFS